MTQHSKAEFDFDEAVTWLTQHGFPTFDEFKKNPDKYRGRPDEIFEAADGSTHSYRSRLGKQIYMFRDKIECKSLEQVQRICREEGIDPMELEMRPVLKPRGGTGSDRRTDICVQFWPKNEFRLFGGIIAND